jgi:hypothetical protein
MLVVNVSLKAVLYGSDGIKYSPPAKKLSGFAG